jgi:hypothetical protein
MLYAITALLGPRAGQMRVLFCLDQDLWVFGAWRRSGWSSGHETYAATRERADEFSLLWFLSLSVSLLVALWIVRFLVLFFLSFP